jgi:predicted HTH domain antitoxin
VEIAIQVPDDVAAALASQGSSIHRTVLEALALEAYRSGAITPAQIQEMLGLGSRWETEAFLRRASAFHDYTIDDLAQEIAAIRSATGQ